MTRFLVKDWLSGIINLQQEISHDEFHQTGGGQKIERSKQTFQIQPQSSNLFFIFLTLWIQPSSKFSILKFNFPTRYASIIINDKKKKQLMCFFPVEKQTSYDRSHLLINLFSANDVHLTSVLFWAIFFLFLTNTGIYRFMLSPCSSTFY